MDVDGVVSQLRRDGYVIIEDFLENIFRSDLYHTFLKRKGGGLSHAGAVGLMASEVNMCMIDLPLTLHPNIVKLATCAPVIEVLEKYLEKDIQLSYCSAYRTHIINNQYRRKKLQAPGVFSGWHSDANVIATNRGYRCLVAMYYMNDVKAGGGGLELVSGSHLYGGQKRPWNPSEVDDFESKHIEITARAGSLIIFDMEMIHRAGIPSEEPRDIVRMMYGPVGTYGIPLIFSNDTLPAQLTAKERQVLRIGQINNTELTLSSFQPPKLSWWNRFRRSKSVQY